MRVLLVEDDAVASHGTALILRSKGVTCDQVDTGEGAFDLVRNHKYEVVLLDLLLPDMDGYEVVRRMRAAAIETPVMIVSGLVRPEARVRGLDLGADEYLTKPFHHAEFFARMQAVIRRSKAYVPPTLRVGSARLNVNSSEVQIGDNKVCLTPKECAILELMFVRKGTLVSKKTFIDHLYGGMDEPGMKIVDVFVCKLRRKLSAAGADGLISTVSGRGYMICEPDSSSFLSVARSEIAALA